LTVLAVRPAHAPSGSQIDITGTDFSPESSNDKVSFDGVLGTVSKATATDLIVTVPEGSSTGKITVTVSGKSAESPYSFTPDALSRRSPGSFTHLFTTTTPTPLIAVQSVGHAAVRHNLKIKARCKQRARARTCPQPKHARASRHKQRDLCTTRNRTHRIRPGHCVLHAHKSKRYKPSKKAKKTTVKKASSHAVATLPFATGAPSSQNTAVPSTVSDYSSPYQAVWDPTASNRRDDDWVSGRSPTPWTSLPALASPRTATGLSGQALVIDGTPLANVTLAVQDTSKQTRTDRTGRFVLDGLSAGHHVLIIDGQSADGKGKRYGRFTVGVDVVKGKVSPLGYTIWMTPLDAAGDRSIEAPLKHETVLTNPGIPGFEVRLPTGTVVHSANGSVVHHLNLTAIPVDRPPFPLPLFATGIPTYFTVQPGGAYLNKGAQIIYPNWGHLPPGQRVQFWNYDPDDKGWYVYGKGSVSNNGEQVIPDPGVRVWEFTGAMISSTSEPPPHGPLGSEKPTGGDPVDLGTGLFVYQHSDLQLPDSTMPVALTRTYRPGDSNSYSFGIGTQSPFDIHLWSNENYTTAYLVLPNGGKVKLKRTSAGSGFIEAVYASVETSGPWEGAVMHWDNTNSEWLLRRRDGTNFIFGELAPLQAIEDRNGNRITLVREGGTKGPITEIRGPHGRSIHLHYDSYNRITEAVDSAGQRVIYAYDTTGRLIKVTDAMNDVTHYGYDSANDMTSVTDARGNVLIANTYGSNGRVLTQTLGGKGTYKFSQLPTCSGCEAEGTAPTEITDPDGHKRIVYFTHWLPTAEVRNPGSSEEWTTYTHNTSGNSTRIVSSSGTISYTYDSGGNVTSVKHESSTLAPLITTYTYNSYSERTSITDPLGRTTSYGYDEKGNLTSITDPMGRQTTFGYDSEGQLTSTTDPQGNTTTYAYAQGERVSTTDPLGHQTKIIYDAAGRPVGILDPEGRLTQFTYDNDNEILSETDPAGDKTSYTYDPDGNVITVTDPRGHTQTATYEAFDRLSSWTDALGRTTSYTYDGIGDLTSLTDPKAQTTSYTYDALNRLSSASFGATGGGSPTSTITYGYNGENELTSVVDSRAGTYTMSYDPYHRLTDETGPNGSVTYTYNAANERESMSIEGEEVAAYAYNPDGQLTNITSPHGEVAFAYDHDGRRAQTILPNGDAEDFSYNAASQLNGITYHNPGGEQIGNLQYSRDALGRTTTISGSEARTNLPSALNETIYDAANELTSLEGHTHTYDADGNLTSDETSTYTWNDRNQLTGVTQGSNTWSYTYDPFGRKTSNTVNGVKTNYLQAGQNVAQESTEGATTELLNGLGLDSHYARTTSAGTNSYLTDQLGSTITLTNETGAPTTEYTYDPFGTTTTTGPSSTNPYQYTGRENNGNGLQNNRARYYEPTLGRFINQDPLGMTGSGPNLYLYTDDSPTNAIDPYGTVAIPSPAPDEYPGSGDFGPTPGETGPGGTGSNGVNQGSANPGGISPEGDGQDSSIPGPGSSCSDGSTQSSGGRGLWGKIRCNHFEQIENLEDENRKEDEKEEGESEGDKIDEEINLYGCGLGGASSAMVFRANPQAAGVSIVACFAFTTGNYIRIGLGL
jgi:RHS repeat-associated protein